MIVEDQPPPMLPRFKIHDAIETCSDLTNYVPGCWMGANRLPWVPGTDRLDFDDNPIPPPPYLKRRGSGTCTA